MIPLCHPLPLNQVQIDILWEDHETTTEPAEVDDEELMDGSATVWIQCTCRVTHKTGVEMEALVGASVAALTVYDMVKAVSHQVRIVETKLIVKVGGKSDVGMMTDHVPHVQGS